MEPVFNVHQTKWQDLSDLKAARGYEFISLVADDPDYTTVYSCELVRLGPADHSVPHVEPWNHLPYFIEGVGDLTIGDRTWSVQPGTSAKVKAGGGRR
jgi:quercetin dioxygenase-like cupin family protein